MFRDFSFLAAASQAGHARAGRVGGPGPMADAHEEREGVARSVFAIHTASDYLPRLACAARR
eukprot:scaffold61367_cov50-Phaeocystis_antarctica.AAC.1